MRAASPPFRIQTGHLNSASTASGHIHAAERLQSSPLVAESLYARQILEIMLMVQASAFIVISVLYILCYALCETHCFLVFIARLSLLKLNNITGSRIGLHAT